MNEFTINLISFMGVEVAVWSMVFAIVLILNKMFPLPWLNKKIRFNFRKGARHEESSEISEIS